MTVESPINKSGPFIASGTRGTFPRNFLVFDPSHVRVVRVRDGVETIITTGVSHSGLGAPSGAVTLSSEIRSGDRITLIRSVPNVQRSDYSAQSSVPTDQVELDFDLVTMQIQDLAERSSRALTLPVDSTQSGDEAMRAVLEAPKLAEDALASVGASLSAANGAAQTAIAAAEAAQASAIAAQQAADEAAQGGGGTGGSVDLSGVVRFDIAQDLTTQEQQQAAANIGVGDPDTDFLQIYTTARDT